MRANATSQQSLLGHPSQQFALHTVAAAVAAAVAAGVATDVAAAAARGFIVCNCIYQTAECINQTNNQSTNE
jgi:hypothetical protein